MECGTIACLALDGAAGGTGGLCTRGFRLGTVEKPRIVPVTVALGCPSHGELAWAAPTGGQATRAIRRRLRSLIAWLDSPCVGYRFFASLNRSSVIGVSGGNGMRFKSTISPSTISSM